MVNQLLHILSLFNALPTMWYDGIRILTYILFSFLFQRTSGSTTSSKNPQMRKMTCLILHSVSLKRYFLYFFFNSYPNRFIIPILICLNLTILQVSSRLPSYCKPWAWWTSYRIAFRHPKFCGWRSCTQTTLIQWYLHLILPTRLVVQKLEHGWVYTPNFYNQHHNILSISWIMGMWSVQPFAFFLFKV